MRSSLAVLLAVVASPAAAQTLAQSDLRAPTVEYQVKASLAFNFLHFVSWPDAALAGNGLTLPVCTIGADEYGDALQVIDGEVAQGRRVTVRAFSSASDPGWVEACRVVILANADAAAIRGVLDAAAGGSILTIGESARFLERGGMIRYVIANDTVQFEINVVEARRARLTISSKLLRLANRVIED